MTQDGLLQTIDGPVARLTLNRPERHNAFDDTLIAALDSALATLAADNAVRVVLLAAAGKSFSAGADLNWMRRMAGYSDAENRADAERLAALLGGLDRLAKPTVALVQGAAIGGGVGLVAACDIAIASEAALFALSEVRLGLIPSVISPYVVAAIGARASRRYMLTAERFDAAEALRLGLVHQVVAADALEDAARAAVRHLLAGGPAAIAESKALVRDVDRPLTDAIVADTAARIARLRASPEGREGVSAFLEKRKPAWTGDGS
jgi:methylglutaconyl-CoA hydratase